MPSTVWKSIKEKGKAVAQSVNLPSPVIVENRSLKFLKLLGEGGFAFLYLCKDDLENKYALKKCMIQTKEQQGIAQAEIDLLKLLLHPHIVKYVGSEIRENQVYILMEFAEKSVIGMMQERHEESRRFNEKEILRMYGDIVSAVAHMHSQNPPIAHRDLKVENILIGSDRNFKLCDFGSCIRSAYEPVTFRDISAVEDEIERNTTLAYRAPEMCDPHSKRRIDEKVDLWALGCVLFYLCFFELPFEEQKLSIINGKYTIPSSHEFSEDVVSMIRDCLLPDPLCRPDIWSLQKRICLLRGVTVPSPPSVIPRQPVSVGGYPESKGSAVLGGHRRQGSSGSTPPASASPTSPTPPVSGLPIDNSHTAPSGSATISQSRAVLNPTLFSALDWQQSNGTGADPKRPPVARSQVSNTSAPLKKSEPVPTKPAMDADMSFLDVMAPGSKANPSATTHPTTTSPVTPGSLPDFNPRLSESSTRNTSSLPFLDDFDPRGSTDLSQLTPSTNPSCSQHSKTNSQASGGSSFLDEEFDPRLITTTNTSVALSEAFIKPSTPDAALFSGGNSPTPVLSLPSDSLFPSTLLSQSSSVTSATTPVSTGIHSNATSQPKDLLKDKAADLLAGFMSSSLSSGAPKPQPKAVTPYASMKRSAEAPITGQKLSVQQHQRTQSGPQSLSGKPDPFSGLF